MLEEALVSTAAAVGLAAYAVRGKSSQLVAPSLWRGDPTRPSIALTFDDGPSESTPLLLELLARYNAQATFFLCGQNVRRCRSITQDIADAGHEIGNHTDSHPPLYLKTPAFIFDELSRAQAAIENVTNVTPRYFRAPYGVRWLGLRSAQKRLNLTGVMWTTTANDWKWPAKRISERLLRAAENGGIFCLHDGRELRANPDIRSTLEAVAAILPVLKQRGFSFETISRVTAPKEIPR